MGTSVSHIRFEIITHLLNVPNMGQYNLGVSDSWKDAAWKTVLI